MSLLLLLRNAPTTPPPETPAQQGRGGKWGFYDRPQEPVEPPQTRRTGGAIGVTRSVGIVGAGVAGFTGSATGASEARAHVGGHATRTGRTYARSLSASREVRGHAEALLPLSLVRRLRDDVDLLTLI